MRWPCVTNGIRLDYKYIWRDDINSVFWNERTNERKKKIHLNCSRSNDNDSGSDTDTDTDDTNHIVRIHNRSLSTNTNDFRNFNFRVCKTVRKCVYTYLIFAIAAAAATTFATNNENETVRLSFQFNPFHVNTCRCTRRLCFVYANHRIHIRWLLSLDGWMDRCSDPICVCRIEMTQCVLRPRCLPDTSCIFAMELLWLRKRASQSL